MTIILEKPDDVVAFVHESEGAVLCVACSKDNRRKHAEILPHLIITPILAKNCGIHHKCDCCQGNLLTTEF